MKRSLFFISAGLIIFAGCFLTSVLIRDFFYARHLRANIGKVKVGMTGKEVINLLGKPDNIHMSDIAGTYWCYNPNSIAQTLAPQPEIICEHLLLQMDGSDIVDRVYDFDR
jgi:hypothetical protein